MPDTAQASSLPQLLEGMRAPLAAVDQWIDAQLVPDDDDLKPLLAHVSRFKGKRLRAAQVVLVGEACGGLRETHTMVAGIIEMIHLATLVHDDLLDEADQRRGVPSLHLAYDNHAAVLLGDWIYAKAFRRSTEIDDRACSRILAEATARMCAGEVRQNLTRGNFQLAEREYLDQIDAKTAALYEAGGRLAAYYAGASEEVQASCGRHGLLAGRAFQMADDLLDLVGDEQRVGKSLGTDLARGKMTLPLIRLRDRLAEGPRAELATRFGSKDCDRGLLNESAFASAWTEVAEACRVEVSALLDEAAACLQPLPAGNARDTLFALTEYLGSRNR